MTADEYLFRILARESVDTSVNSPVWSARQALLPILKVWGGRFLQDVSPSGSFAKGTANKSGTDIDLFLSLSTDTPETLKQIYETLYTALSNGKLAPRRQNVSIGVRVGGVDVDLVPGKRQNAQTLDHSLYRRKADTWTKTNVQTHINHVLFHGYLMESRVLKLWRNQKGLDFPSFLLELAVIESLSQSVGAGLADRVWRVLGYLASDFRDARLVDPANTNNIISDDLTAAEKAIVKTAASRALQAKTWEDIVI